MPAEQKLGVRFDGTKRINDFATPDVINLLCRVVAGRYANGSQEILGGHAMKHFASLICLVVLGLPLQAQSASINDGDFVAWSSFSFVTDDPFVAGPPPNVSHGSAVPVLAGGNPGAFLQTTHTFTSGDTIWTGGIKTDYVYEPAVTGPIAAVSISADAKMFGAGASAWQLVVEQAGKRYFSFPLRAFSGDWTSVTASDLTAANFDTNPWAGNAGILPDGNRPDFGATAAPLRFGFLVGNRLPGFGTVTASHGIDNFSLSILPETLTVTPGNIVFPNKIVGTATASQIVTLRNSGTASGSIGTLTLTGPNAGDFSLFVGSCSGATLAPGGQCTFSVKFKPTATGTRLASVDIPSSLTGLRRLDLAGTGYDAVTFPLLPTTAPGTKAIVSADIRGIIDPAKPTIVMTHGLSCVGDDEDGKLWTGFGDKQAGQLLSTAVGSKVNVLQYTWKDAFKISTSNINPECAPTRAAYKEARAKVHDAGLALAQRLSLLLGPTYNKSIHFIGHSLGTAVNAYAAKSYLAGTLSVKDSQVTVLDYPNQVHRIPATPQLFGDFEEIYGFDPNFFASVLPFARTGLSLKLDNIFADTPTIAGVGSPINGLAYNHPGLKDPNDLNFRLFKEAVFGNDHSGVQQWYRWTINPNAVDTLFAVCSTLSGNLLNLDPTFDITLNPCSKGFSWSINGPKPGDFPVPNAPPVISSGSVALLLESYIERGCTIGGSAVSGFTYGLTCKEASSPFFIGQVTIPDTADYLNFDYEFKNVGDGDYAAVLIDDIPVWVIAGSSAAGGLLTSSGPIPIRGFRGPRTVVVALYGVGGRNAEITFGGFRTNGMGLLGDIDGDRDVDQNDLNIIIRDLNKPVSGSSCGPRCDLNGDGIINALDARKLTLLCTRPRCATQ